MKDLIVQQGLMRPLLGKEERQPDDMKDVEWAELEQRCVNTIRLCIGDNVFDHVIDEDSALRLWAKLEKIYLAKSLSNKLQLRRKLYRLKMEENGDLMKHMNEFDGIIYQLKKVDVKVEEEEKALLFMASLPDSYGVFVESLVCGMDTITLKQAQATLMSREARKKSKEGDGDPNGLALVIEANRRKSIGKGSKGGKSRSNNVQCFKCKGYGHIKRDCPTKEDESNKNKESEASKGWEQCIGDGSYQSEISFAEEVMKGSHGVDDGERTKNLASSELEGSSRVETDDDKIELLLSQVKGKDLAELIAVGREKLAAMSSGGATVAGTAAAVGDPAATPAVSTEAKKEEKIQEESDDDMCFSLFD
ncbi:zinc finger protein [Theobroma cacao]|nr:zinc finger protein [Theobroma cacao]